MGIELPQYSKVTVSIHGHGICTGLSEPLRAAHYENELLTLIRKVIELLLK